MQHESHPHDERLAALAGADREATDDRALRDHVDACDRCRAVVDDLFLLRSALAELPDLRPSRPLQLLPPVAAPAAPRSGLLGRLRRLSAPALAAGAALILVGAIGSTGVVENFAGSASSRDSVHTQAAANVHELAESPDATDSGTGRPAYLDSGGSPPTDGSSPKAAVEPGAVRPSSAEGSFFTPAPTRDGDATAIVDSTSDPLSGRVPWLVALGLGVALAGGSLLLRFTVQPRAG